MEILELYDYVRARRGAAYTPLQPPEITSAVSGETSPWGDPNDTGQPTEHAHVYTDTQ